MRKNRNYKRKQGHRDAVLFVIACEGQITERRYFEALAAGKQRLQVRTMSPDQNKSAPKYVVGCADRFLDGTGGIEEGDQVWIVIDRDRWTSKGMHEARSACKEKGYQLLVSNPCFELWLYLHLDTPKLSPKAIANLYDCRSIKDALKAEHPDGYNSSHYDPVWFVARTDIALGRIDTYLTAAPDLFKDDSGTNIHELVRAIRGFK